MKTKTIRDITGTSRDVKFTGGNSQRLLLAKDGMGFSLSKTIIPKGKPNHWNYKHHKEACYCISGKGVLTDLETNEVFEINPETLYILDNHENHTFEALTDVILISVFNPPLIGNESHDKNGVYKSSNNN